MSNDATTADADNARAAQTPRPPGRSSRVQNRPISAAEAATPPTVAEAAYAAALAQKRAIRLAAEAKAKIRRRELRAARRAKAAA